MTMSVPEYITALKADESKLGDQVYAAACIKTILAAHSVDEPDFGDFSKVVSAAKVLPENHSLRVALEAPNADDNWQMHISHLNTFHPAKAPLVAAELNHAVVLASKVGSETMKMYPVATAKRIIALDPTPQNIYSTAIAKAFST
jgi:hypothetical protein